MIRGSFSNEKFILTEGVFVLNKKIKIIAASLLVTSALAACGTPKNKNAMDRNATDNYERTSYENAHPHRDNVARTGPHTDYVTYHNDRRSGEYGDVRYTRINQNVQNRRDNVGDSGSRLTPSTTPNTTMENTQQKNGTNAGAISERPKASTISEWPKTADAPGAAEAAEAHLSGKLAQEVTNRVKGMDKIERVATLVRGHNVFVAIKPHGNTDEKALEADIQKAIADIVKDRHVYVTTKDDMFTRVEKLSAKLQDGIMEDGLHADITHMFGDHFSTLPNVVK